MKNLNLVTTKLSMPRHAWTPESVSTLYHLIHAQVPHGDPDQTISVTVECLPSLLAQEGAESQTHAAPAVVKTSRATTATPKRKKSSRIGSRDAWATLVRTLMDLNSCTTAQAFAEKIGSSESSVRRLLTSKNQLTIQCATARKIVACALVDKTLILPEDTTLLQTFLAKARRVGEIALPQTTPANDSSAMKSGVRAAAPHSIAS